MGTALYRKYRSKRLDDVIGQPHITTSLSNALKQDTVSHAYLFTGPRGVGKTSVARIFAHEVNDLDYDGTTYLDIIEIDAASNRRIDEIRDLKEKVHTVPSQAKYKVYIIDEVHMLTKEAFNALLKTLEEPPQHVIFILATTESHKLPETIVSRTQRYNFKPIDNGDAKKHLKNLAKKEKIQITDEALDIIIAHGEGSFRDSISLLDQAQNYGEVTAEVVEQMLGLAPQSLINELTEAVIRKDQSHIMTILQKLFVGGQTGAVIAKQLISSLRNMLLQQKSGKSSELLELMQNLLTVNVSPDSELLLELILLKYSSEPALVAEPTVVVDQMVETPVTTKPAPVKPKLDVAIEPLIEHTVVSKPEKKAPETDKWSQVLAEVKKHHNTLYSFTRMANPKIQQDVIVLEFEFALHKNKISDAKNQKIVEDIIRNIYGTNYTVKTELNKSNSDNTRPKTVTPDTKTATSQHVANISNIFGGAEVLE